MELATLKSFFAASPFLSGLGVQPVAATSGRERVLVMKASATMALLPKDD